ncbi:MAG TPA: Na+/H+ antiporter subunit G [Thauera sp.]|nr:Na+/H+ antiporter subunit G [Thauera sp.]
MTMNLIFEIVIAALIVVGGVFTLVGSWGMVKLPELMSRLHAPTKATTLGVGGALLAAMLNSVVFRDVLSLHELLISVFLFLTAPITAHFLAKAHIHRHVDPERELPQLDGSGWSTFERISDSVHEGPDEGEVARPDVGGGSAHH